MTETVIHSDAADARYTMSMTQSSRHGRDSGSGLGWDWANVICDS